MSSSKIKSKAPILLDQNQVLENFRNEIKNRTNKASQITREANPNIKDKLVNSVNINLQKYEIDDNSSKPDNSILSLRAGTNPNIKFSQKNYSIVSFIKSEEKRTNEQQYFNPEELDFELNEKSE